MIYLTLLFLDYFKINFVIGRERMKMNDNGSKMIEVRKKMWKSGQDINFEN